MAAIDSLSSLREDPFHGASKRGFGTAVQTVIDYFDLYEDLNHTSVVSFLSGHVSHGMGFVHDIPSNHRDIFPQTDFFRKQSLRALEAGMSFHLFVCTPNYASLSSLKFLCLKTGGSLFHYEDSENSMPQDVFRHFKSAQAMRCLLRIRTAEEFSTADSYGIEADVNHKGLFRLSSCDRNKCHSFALQFDSPAGFSK